MLRHLRPSSSRPILLWGSDTNRICNMHCNRFSLCSYAAKLCPTRISAKCIKWHRLDLIWCTSTYSEACLLGPRVAFWWSCHLTPFSYSMASEISWFDSYGLLVFGIHQIQSLRMESINFVRVKRFYKEWDCKHPSYYVAFSFTVHHLSHTMRNCLRWHPCEKCLI